MFVVCCYCFLTCIRNSHHTSLLVIYHPVDKLSLIRLNVRGLNGSRKRHATFRQLHPKNASIIFFTRDI